jgi:hypothetical protein
LYQIFRGELLAFYLFPKVGGALVQGEHFVKVHLGQALAYHNEFSADGAQDESVFDFHKGNLL